ncbi:helix-turn-helix domain-containing protein [Burkholderia cepacia]|uniref:helix-turn-helix domain-containing protein n=1 Tax=Burkholderia cepacia TaxID=292 RepID=UPI001CF5C6DD|nr:helix-turn-helix domain-containing protein [Burkholderia cepacia]MCA8110274.1 helix-turn-helix domain-containing protein [Burkholderia cepacia]MCA8396573.1 helix-turn-helix domain-containing protein [Burkholderia cepacia]
MSKPFKKKSGVEKVQQYLESGRSITALEALSNFGLFRLASAIGVLRKRGLNIVTDTKQDPNGKNYARYTLVKVANKAPEVEAEVAPKRELEVGDRVKVKSYGSDAKHRYIGMQGEVKAISRASHWPVTVSLDGMAGFDYFKDAELGLVEPVKELKVGARVRVTDKYPEAERHGLTGTLVRVREGAPFPFYMKPDNGTNSGLYTANELEAI